MQGELLSQREEIVIETVFLKARIGTDALIVLPWRLSKYPSSVPAISKCQKAKKTYVIDSWLLHSKHSLFTSKGAYFSNELTSPAE